VFAGTVRDRWTVHTPPRRPRDIRGLR